MNIQEIIQAFNVTKRFATHAGSAIIEGFEFDFISGPVTVEVRFVGSPTCQLPGAVFERMVQYPEVSIHDLKEALLAWKLQDIEAAKKYVRDNFDSIIAIPDSRRYEVLIHANEQAKMAASERAAIETARIRCQNEYTVLSHHMGDDVAEAWKKTLGDPTRQDVLSYNTLAEFYRAVTGNEGYPDGYEGVRHPTLEQLMEAVKRLTSHSPTAMLGIAHLMDPTARGWDVFPACRRAEVMELIERHFVQFRPVLAVGVPWVPPKEATGFTGFYNAWRTIRSKYLTGLKVYAGSKDLHRSHVPPEIKKTIFVHALKLWLRDDT